MSSPFNKMIAGGIELCLIGFYDEDGIFAGAAGKLADGEDSGMARWEGIQQFEMTIPEPVRQTQTGDGRVQGTMVYAPTDPMSLGIQAGLTDFDLEAVMQDIAVEDIDGLDVLAIHPDIVDWKPAALISHAPAKKKVVGANEQEAQIVHIINHAEIAVGNGAMNERTVVNFAYSATCAQTYRYPWGHPYTDAASKVLRGAGGKFTTKSNVVMHAFQGDGVATGFDVDWTPVGDHSVAGAWSAYQYNPSTGEWAQLTAGTDFEVAGKTFTHVATATPTAPTAGLRTVVRYLTNEEPV